MGNLDLKVGSGGSDFDRINDRRNDTAYARPACGKQADNGDAPNTKVLLIPKARVGRDKDFEAVLFSGVQQLTVLQRRPAALVSRRHFVVEQRLAQRDRSTLIEENAHSGGCQCTACRVFEDRANLVERDARKQREKLAHRNAILEIFKQGRYGHASASKQPSAAEASRIALDRITG